jgi:predicted transposase/invertase (TIGR01784 family)
LHHEASLYESTYVLGQLQGEEKGMEKGILMMARNMKKQGIDLTMIATVTGLSIEEIKALS